MRRPSFIHWRPWKTLVCHFCRVVHCKALIKSDARRQLQPSWRIGNMWVDPWVDLQSDYIWRRQKHQHLLGDLTPPRNETQIHKCSKSHLLLCTSVIAPVSSNSEIKQGVVLSACLSVRLQPPGFIWLSLYNPPPSRRGPVWNSRVTAVSFAPTTASKASVQVSSHLCRQQLRWKIVWNES